MSGARARGGWRDAASAIDREPVEGWRDLLVHHGFRGVTVLGIALLVPLFFPRVPLPDFALLEEGMVAPEDVIAEIGFAVPKSAAQLEAERREAERAVAPIFALDPTAIDSAVGRVRQFFAGLDSAIADSAAPDSADVRAILVSYSVPVDSAQVAYLLSTSNRRELEDALEGAYRTSLPGGVSRASDIAAVRTGQILVRGPEVDRLVRRDSVLTAGRFYELAIHSAPAAAPAAGIQLYQTLLVRFNEPSLRPDGPATQVARRQARAVVDTIAGFVLEGERIVSAHERVTRQDIARMRAYHAELITQGLAGGRAGFARGFGGVLYSLVLLLIVAVVLKLFRPTIYAQAAGYLIVMSLILLVLLAASAIARSEIPHALIPIALAGLLLGALYDGLVGLVTVMATAALLGGQTPFSGITVPFLVTAGGAAAALGVRGVHRRAQSWILIAGITGAYLVAGTALVTMRSLPFGELVEMTLWGGVSATLSTVLAIQAVLPALEKLTGITTDQTLLELSDLNAPLLRELSRKAPGTYVHSINVANLAETTCVAIGVSPLLVRVGAYYHDIGKMLQPEYFVENQPKGRNPHDRLPPSRSAEIIREHVRDGLRLAAEHRLPPVIRDFIREHHGTQLISYFYDKAKTEEPDGDLDPRDFAYAGPKPQTRASAVLMLADSVESSSRVLQDPTPDRIRALIERIVEIKTSERQLDQSPLTLKDLDVIKAHFARVLIGLYHRRIEYPSGVGAGPQGRGAGPRARGAKPDEGGRLGGTAGVPEAAETGVPPDIS